MTTPSANASERLRSVTIKGRLEIGTVEGLRLENCVFDNCWLGNTSRPHARVVIRDIEVQNAAQRACFVNGAILDGVTIHGLRRVGNIPVITFGCVFRHVKLSGKVSGVKINRAISSDPSPFQSEWDRANRDFYDAVDWALDISKAQFQGGISLEAIPGKLIRRDDETQVLIRRESLLQADWRSLDFGWTGYDHEIDWFLKGSPFDSIVLVAAKASKKFKEDLAVLNLLRREGLAT